MEVKFPQERLAPGPARSISAVVVAAFGSTLLFWLVGRSIPWGADLQVGFLVVSFGVLLLVSVGYSITVDHIWRRTHREANDAMVAFKGDFVADVSHELRTALTGIVGFAQLLDPRVVGGDNAEAIKQVIGQSAELSRVVDDLTAISRRDAGLLEVQSTAVSLLEEVESAVEFVGLMGVDVAVECHDARVLVDQERFRHVLRNLLVNAFRHGAPGFSVRGQTFGKNYICQVVDHGPGIGPEAEQSLLPASRSNTATSSDPDSLGLGLTVVNDLVARMNCTLSYRRIRGETHFILTIPLASAESEESEPRFTPGYPVPRLKRTDRNSAKGDQCVASA